MFESTFIKCSGDKGWGYVRSATFLTAAFTKENPCRAASGNVSLRLTPRYRLVWGHDLYVAEDELMTGISEIEKFVNNGTSEALDSLV